MADSKVLTVADVQKHFAQKKNTITDEIVDILNNAQHEPEFQGETLLQTAITYEAVLQRNKVSIKEYLNAIRFCAYLLSMNDNFTEAYKKTFSDRGFVIDRIDADTSSVKYGELTSAASRYRRSKLVVDILTMSQVPLKLLYRGYSYKAMDVLYNIAVSGKFDRDRVAAAKTILEMTADTENIKIELDVGVKEDSAIKQLNDQLAQFASQSLIHLQHGTTSLDKLGGMKVLEDVIDIDAE